MDIHDIYKTFIVARDINCWKLLNIFEKSSFDKIEIRHLTFLKNQVLTKLRYIITQPLGYTRQNLAITLRPALGTMRLIARKMLFVRCVGQCLQSLTST